MFMKGNNVIQLLVYDGFQTPVNLPVIPRIGEEVIPPSGGSIKRVANVRYNLTGVDEDPSSGINYGVTIYLDEK
jgi:hypothetical protein